jgi:chromosome segregation ATPase
MKATEKTKIVSQSVPESVRLGNLLAETVAIIAQKQAGLTQIPSEKLPLLGEGDLNVEGIAQLDVKKTALNLDIGDLEVRRQLLTEQVWAAECTEAQARLVDINTDCGRLVHAASQAQAVVAEAEGALVAALDVLATIHTQHLERLREHNWLVHSYRIPPVALPRLGEFTAVPELTVKVGRVIDRLHQAQLRPLPPRKVRPRTDSVFADD